MQACNSPEIYQAHSQHPPHSMVPFNVIAHGALFYGWPSFHCIYLQCILWLFIHRKTYTLVSKMWLIFQKVWYLCLYRAKLKCKESEMNLKWAYKLYDTSWIKFGPFKRSTDWFISAIMIKRWRPADLFYIEQYVHRCPHQKMSHHDVSSHCT